VNNFKVKPFANVVFGLCLKLEIKQLTSVCMYVCTQIKKSFIHTGLNVYIKPSE